MAVAKNLIIGKGGGIPWKLSSDMKRFSQITKGEGNNAVLMGRKTHESIGRKLHGRTNIVLTRQPDYRAAEGCYVVYSFREAFILCADKGISMLFAIGGGEVYEAAFEFATELYLTEVDVIIEDGDASFPEWNREEWQIDELSALTNYQEEGDEYPYDFKIFRREE
ncbi:MAG: dihydrofolate reductase [Parcubacteria group bacterium]